MLACELFAELLAIEEDEEEVEVNKLSIEKLDFLFIGDFVLLLLLLLFIINLLVVLDSFVDIIEDEVSGDDDDGEAKFSLKYKIF